MLTHPPHLSILRPSPSTIQFTVSTASPLDSLSSRLRHSLILILRALLLCAILLVLACKSFSHDPATTSALTPAPALVGSTATGEESSWRAMISMRTGVLYRLSDYVVPISWMYLAPILAFGVLIVFGRFYTEESLLTLRSLGIQTRSLSPYYLFPAATRFIPTSQIVDIFIHEAFRGFEVRYYLAVVVEGEGAVVVVFPKLLPCRSIVEHVWRGARECLYEPKSPSPAGGPTDTL